jgi:hypothetical protein
VKRLSLACIIVALATSAALGNITTSIIVPVLPEGDGTGGKDRWGYGYGWEAVPFDSAASPNAALHWYDSPNGQSRDTYLQVALAGLPTADDISVANLLLNITELAGSGTLANVYHASNPSSATGNAADQITGDQLIGTIDSSVPLGTLTLDVTSYIKADIQNGYAWSVFSVSSPGYTTVKFSSAEDTANAPNLQVEAVPEPGSFALLAGAAGAALLLSLCRTRT